MKVGAKQQKRTGQKKQDPKRTVATRKPGEKPAVPATEEEVSAQTEQAVTSEGQSSSGEPKEKEWEKQPRVNEDAQRNIVNNPEHAQQDVTDQHDK
jgi:hypothetical protein